MGRTVKRDERGRIISGSLNPAGKTGAKSAAVEIRRNLVEKVTEQDWDDIRLALVQKSKSGDIKAIALLLAYAIGRPVAGVDLNFNQNQITPEEAQAKIAAFFGIDGASSTCNK